MKRYTPAALLPCLLAGPAASSGADLAVLAWLSGCWAAENGEAGSGEHWLMPAGGTMLGISRTIRDGRTAGFEFLRISEAADGGITLTAAPSGQAVTAFALTRMTANEAVFENLDHDFPQRVTYLLTSDERLVGRIEGTLDGETQQIEFPMAKADCAEHFGGQPP